MLFRPEFLMKSAYARSQGEPDCSMRWEQGDMTISAGSPPEPATSVHTLPTCTDPMTSRDRSDDSLERCHRCVPVTMDHKGAVSAFAVMTVGAAGAFGIVGPTCSWVIIMLHGQAREVAFALFNSLGALGAFAGPTIIGRLSNKGDWQSSLYFLGGLCLLVAFMALCALFFSFLPRALLLSIVCTNCAILSIASAHAENSESRKETTRWKTKNYILPWAEASQYKASGVIMGGMLLLKDRGCTKPGNGSFLGMSARIALDLRINRADFLQSSVQATSWYPPIKMPRRARRTVRR